MLDSPRRRMPVPALARWLVGLSIAATLAANVAHGLGHGLIGRRPPRHSRDSFRLSACPRCARSAPGCIWGSRVPAATRISGRSTAPRRRGRLPNIGLPWRDRRRLPDGNRTADSAKYPPKWRSRKARRCRHGGCGSDR
jgi:hypothetical protein